MVEGSPTLLLSEGRTHNPLRINVLPNQQTSREINFSPSRSGCLHAHEQRLKREYPSWGAPTIRERLRQRCPEVQCPAISTVHAVLDRHGLVTRRTRRRHRAEGTALSHPGQPNDLWCADDKGEFMLADRRYCY